MERPLDQESLFSLELAVENLCIPDVVCRFPAIAFRLLDFPTLMIYHVEPEVASTIKSRISQDPSIKLPSQLRELKDRHDNFIIKKGKSCIFKVSPQTLHTHLTNTPLYVMIIDTYPEVPKLVGNCSVPMDVVMNRVYSDVRKFGISTPSVQGERGDYKVYNLMGREIGKVTMGFRLLSLGVGLLPHIPEKNVVKVGQNLQVAVSAKKIDLTPEERVEDAREIIIKDIKAADKSMQVSLSASFDNRNIQTESTLMQNAGVQTLDKKKSQRKAKGNVMTVKSESKPSQSVDDIFVTNVECPPPLFYNSEFAEPPRASGLTFYDNTNSTDHQKYTMFGDPESPHQLEPTFSFNSSDWSDDGTIRLEDDASVSDDVDFESSRIVRTTKSSRHKMVRTPARPHQETVQGTATMMPLTGNFSQFPMLNALLSEIVALQGQGRSGQQPLQQLKAQQKAYQEVVIPQDPPVTPAPAPPAPKSAVRGKENREEILSRLATPRNPVPKHKTDDSANIGHKQPLKRQPSLGVQKKKLAYGMTNTQRLRLAKVKPELLKSLEKEEEERVKRIRAELREKGIGLAAFQKAPSMDELDNLEKADHQQSPEVKRNVIYSSVDEASVLTTSEHKKRPVPTPRLSVYAMQDTQSDKFKEQGVRESQSAPALRRKQSDYYSGESRPTSATSQQSRAKSIDIHLPASESDHHDDEDGTSAEGSHFDEPDRDTLGQTKTLYDPGFPPEVYRQSVESHTADYSEDFERSNQYDSAGEEPELRKVVDYYSDQSEEAAEPSLRKVVDNYSDDDDQSGAQMPQLQQYVESYADESESGSFETASSQRSAESPAQPVYTTGAHLPASQLNLQSSATAPYISSRQSAYPSPHILAASSATFNTQSSVAPTESVESTAYISRSQIPSETGTSVESYTDTRLTRRPAGPRPSPRRKVERMSSVHTESVSSYAPSDPENVSPGPLSPVDDIEGYSDAFDSASSDDDRIGTLQHQDVRNMAISEKARLGYTWT